MYTNDPRSSENALTPVRFGLSITLNNMLSHRTATLNVHILLQLCACEQSVFVAQVLATVGLPKADNARGIETARLSRTPGSL